MSLSADSALELHVRDEGTGAPVLLLHGVGGSHTVWNEIVAPLASDFRVLAPDLRGHGRSPAPKGSTYSFDELSRDLLGLLDARHVDRVHAVGLSGGALLALRIALDRPDRLRSLTMIGGSVYTDAHTRSVAQRWRETYARDGPDAFALRLLKDLYYPDWIEAHLDFADRLRAEVKHQDFTGAVRWAGAMESFDERGRIASLRVPTLIVQAMDDAVVDASHGRILRQSINGAQMRIFAQTGHMVPTERPTELAEALASFWHGVDAGPTARA